MPATRRRRRRSEPLRLRRQTVAFGGLAAASVAAVLAIEFSRIWRLGSAERRRGPQGVVGAGRDVVRVARQGYRVSATRENAAFTMLGSFIVTFALARAVTYSIRTHGGLGPIHDVQVGSRHIHHFVPGVAISLSAGGAAISSRREDVDRWMAIPFGAGVALVLDESALMIELEDVYWSQKGVLSIHAAFAATTILSLLAYLVQVLRHGEAQLREQDWLTAAKAWDDLRQLGVEGGER